MTQQPAMQDHALARRAPLFLDRLADPRRRRAKTSRGRGRVGGRVVIAFKRRTSATAAQIRDFVRSRPDAVIIVFACTSDIEPSEAVELMRAGAFDIILQPIDAATLSARLAEADVEARRRTVLRRAQDKARKGLESLTPRETDVTRELVSGAPNKIVARRLGLSHRTVEFHRARIYQKLTIKSIAELTRITLSADRFGCDGSLCAERDATEPLAAQA